MEHHLHIRDYAVIGDIRTAALVGRNGSIDWYCWPRFDSPAVFCRLLDADKGGHFQVEPVNTYTVSRSYVEDSNVLATTFETREGQMGVLDFMPIADDGLDETAHGHSSARLRSSRARSLGLHLARPTIEVREPGADLE